MTAYRMIGPWTDQDRMDAEDNVEPKRFVWNHENRTVRVKHQSTKPRSQNDNQILEPALAATPRAAT